MVGGETLVVKRYYKKLLRQIQKISKKSYIMAVYLKSVNNSLKEAYNINS